MTPPPTEGDAAITESKLNRPWMLLALLLVAVTIAGGITVWSRYRPGRPIEISLPPEPAFEGHILVHGAVANPGRYPFAGTDSLEALVRAAGGPIDDADLGGLQLYLPRAGTESEPQKIDINRAEAWLLEALPGIGATRARAIVEFRQQNGPFRSVDELTRVEGIGAATLERIRSLVTVAD